jgi:hypothetical protein
MIRLTDQFSVGKALSKILRVLEWLKTNGEPLGLGEAPRLTDGVAVIDALSGNLGVLVLLSFL